MKHKWDDVPTGILGPQTRRCVHCGAEQHIEEETWYMRVTARRWRPLVGRCKGGLPGATPGNAPE